MTRALKEAVAPAVGLAAASAAAEELSADASAALQPAPSPQSAWWYRDTGIRIHRRMRRCLQQQSADTCKENVISPPPLLPSQYPRTLNFES